MNAAIETQRWTPAGTSAQERLNNPSECGCCGRQGLKKTIKMRAVGGASILWMGVGCAAKAAVLGVKQLQEAAALADDAIMLAERCAGRSADAAWQAFLDSRTTVGLDRFTQIQKLGGYKAAKAAFLGS